MSSVFITFMGVIFGSLGLYWYKQQYSSSGLWQKYYDGGKQCIPFFPVMLKDGTATTDTANKLPIFELGLNVGEVSQKTPVSNMSLASTTSLLTAITDTFPDGRTATLTWECFNGNIYRSRYHVFNTSGTKIASGQFGSTRNFGSSDTKYELFVFALSNSKLIAAYFILDHAYFYEVYRVSELTDSGGDVASSSGSIGFKDITPPEDTDTYPVKSSVDFSKSDIPLGYNIKDGAITEEKLNSSLREDITVSANAINVGDIVIVKRVGYISGKYNTGQTLETLSNYSYDYGSAYIRFYNNGNYFQWYCYNPELLDEGEYHKSFIVGKKTIYLRLKIIAPPTNSGTTAVTF